jgi:hypothetical protein
MQGPDKEVENTTRKSAPEKRGKRFTNYASDDPSP